MEAYSKPISVVFAETGSSEAGLTAPEAASRLQREGKNALTGGRKRSAWVLFFSQFRDLMTLILIAAAFLSGVLAFVTGERGELTDTFILLFVILLNAVVGFLQQYRADRAIDALKQLSKGTAKVVRDGKVLEIDAEELVVGDVVELEEGDAVPADCRILSSEGLKTDESALTGESKPVKKYDCIVTRSAVAERPNTVFASTYCVKGTARCLVTATGMETEMGKIAALLKEEKRTPSPLDSMIAKLGKIITFAVFAVAAVLFLGGMLARRVGLLENLMSAVAVAVAAIPEGMGAVVTVILAMGVKRMAKSRAVMRKLSSVEALGSCTVICSDKTGTLTKNKMCVETVLPEGDERALFACIRACHSVKGEAGSYLGDPTEIALLEYVDRRGFSYPCTRLGGTPFSSERKMMSVLVRERAGEVLFAKGGAEVILRRCSRILTPRGIVPLSEKERGTVLKNASSLSAQAMRVLGFSFGEREEEMVFLGLVALSDPPREGVKEAIATCRRAGIKTVMITGDSPETAFAVAEKLGIASSRTQVVTGEEIDGMGEDFARRVHEFCVYARVSPKHKSEIVAALQGRGEVVAMTGDGVNDAPALKAADIGVAMGSGTDVTKGAADVVLSDDDFTTMVRAVEEGRNVFFNIKRTISFFLATNLAEVLCVLCIALFFPKYAFLTSTQLLWVNLITDSLPVLALGVERTQGAMERPPVTDREIFSFRALGKVALAGGVQAALLILMFALSLKPWGNAAAATMAFVGLSLVELFHAFNVRREDGTSSFFSNRVLLATVAAGILLSVLLVAVPPLCALFDLTPLTWPQWGVTAAVSLLSVPIVALCGKLFSLPLKRRKRRIPLAGTAR